MAAYTGNVTITWSPAAQIAAGVVVAAGALLALEYDKVAKDALDKAEDIAERIFAIESDITDHWMTTQYPQTLAVVNEIYGYAPPSVAYGEAIDKATSYGSDLRAKAEVGKTVSQDRYRFCVDSVCNRELDIYTAAAEVDFAQQLMRHQERRNERQTQMHIEYASRAYRASREAPDDIFSLLRNAQNIYGNIYNAAVQSTDGAIGLIGQGMGTFIGGFFEA